jgi:hypothetical protein
MWQRTKDLPLRYLTRIVILSAKVTIYLLLWTVSRLLDRLDRKR